ncbi:MAG: HEAT repeat domain-containing protein [Planctomycetaceae bacterium]|nr:HEAT repeat domain-containing protein [Planctomycetaceae bacterium]
MPHRWVVLAILVIGAASHLRSPPAGTLCGQPPAASLRDRIDEELTAMELHGSAYNPKGLHEMGTAGLAGVLDHFFPETAAVKVVARPPEEEVKRLIEQLGSDEFKVRELATEQLIARGKPCRDLLLKAAESDDAEVRLRAQRILAAWEPKADGIGDRGLGGFWNYADSLRDGERLDLVARRVMAEFDRGWPQGPKLHLLRLCVAGVAKGGNEASCDLLRPLVASQDVRIAKFVTETTGSYKADEQFFPQLLLDALASDRDEVVEVAIRWTQHCHKSPRAGDARRAMRSIFERRSETLKFQVCLPLIQEFDDPQAWAFLIEQAESKTPLRSASALSSLADLKYSGRQASETLLEKLAGHLSSPTLAVRWGATKALGTHAGPAVIERLIPLLADSEQSVREEAARCLLKQSNAKLVREQLSTAAREHPNQRVREHAADVLKHAR